MTDLHAHILPGLDDGAADMDEALAMCRIAATDGITSIVATPHTGNGVYTNTRQTVLAAVDALNGRIREEGIGVTIFPGADVHVDHDIAGMLASGEAMTVNDNGRYMMVELPHQTIPPNFDDWIFAVRLKGITPIITHPERNLAIERNIKELARWVELGVLVQITAMSVTGRFGASVGKAAHDMLERNLVHVIASDAHSVKRRPPILSEARDEAARLLGDVRADQLVRAYPAMIMKGMAVDAPPPPEEPRKQGFLNRLLQRR